MSIIVHDALDLNYWPPEIDQQANLQMSGFQVIEASGHMDFIKRLYGFQLDEDGAFDQQIHNVVAYDLSII